ncbi:MAG TPA: glutathione S-transferase C-terminal domain-containing protein [Streptosporangiaceae bacterium]|nr:glutathione S-transferase C-terminal domain-containing protein [Streptosporangiaceae bacterium]
MPAMPEPSFPHGRVPAEAQGGPPWASGMPPDTAGPPWPVSEPQAGPGPPWPVSEPRASPRPPRPVSEPLASAGPPRPVSAPHASAGPPWTVSEPPASAGPPWAVDDRAAADRPQSGAARPAVADQPMPGSGPASGGPASGGGTFSHGPTDSSPSTGSLPAITGGLIRRQGTFTGRITRDGSSGFAAEPARYQLYASLACPWSQRTLIACRLLGLDRVIGLTLTDPVVDERGWKFDDDGGADPLTGARLLADLYQATDPTYQGPYTLPLIWDQRSRRVVCNDVAQITVMLETEFRPFHKPGAPDLYPASRRRDIESLATLVFHTVNTGVYKAGLATTQAGYDQAVDALFTTLDALDERLARRRFLLGDLLTEADVRLYPTLARFDAVYSQLFNCNLRRLSDYRHLWGYARDLYTLPGFGETTDLGQIKRHYYQSAEWGNKFGIIPIGPQIDWNEPHGRARMTA